MRSRRKGVAESSPPSLWMVLSVLCSERCGKERNEEFNKRATGRGVCVCVRAARALLRQPLLELPHLLFPLSL